MDLFDELTTGAEGLPLGNLPRTDEVARTKNILHPIEIISFLTCIVMIRFGNSIGHWNTRSILT